MTVLAGEVQQWRDGKWRTILTVAGYPVTDRRPGYVREQQDQGVLFGFSDDFAAALADGLADFRRLQDRIGEERWRSGGYQPGQRFDVPQHHDHVHVRRWT